RTRVLNRRSRSRRTSGRGPPPPGPPHLPDPPLPPHTHPPGRGGRLIEVSFFKALLSRGSGVRWERRGWGGEGPGGAAKLVDRNRRNRRFYVPRNSPIGASDSLWSQKILITTMIGTASTAPVIPQIQPQKVRPRKMTTGFKVSRRPRISGVS